MRPLSNCVYRPYGRALGDCWSDVNYFIHLGLKNNETVRLSLWYPKGSKIRRVDKLKEIVPLFENDDTIQLGEWESTVCKIHWTLGFANPFMPTKIQWKPNSSRRVCYQFDKKSYAEGRFASKEIEDDILKTIEGHGYTPVRLGWEQTLQQCVEELSKCELFIGVDSGMAYVAASAGTPILFCKNGRPYNVWDTIHSNKHFILATDQNEVKTVFGAYAKNGLPYYLTSARNMHLFRNA